MSPLDLALSLAALSALAAAAYLAMLAALSMAGRHRGLAAAAPHLRFDLVVPAHDEERTVERTVHSLAALDDPAGLRRILVVADNCSDRTAERATAAGAQVLERRDADAPGKGQALAWAFARLLGDAFDADATVVVDADTVVSANLLSAFAARLAVGARAVQADYCVENPDASWRTRLMAVAFTLFHTVRSLGRERLQLSAGLRGNGMCFSKSLLRHVPYDAFCLVEDLEFGLRLGEAGVRVFFAGEAKVLGEMPSTGAASASQRRRWEGGRRALARRRTASLFKLGLARRDPVLLDLAVDLAIPPLAALGAAALVGLLASLAAARLGLGIVLAPWLFAAALALLALYVARGWQLSGTGLKGLVALAGAPAYLAWKLFVRWSRPAHPDGAWIRTAREGEVRRWPA